MKDRDARRDKRYRKLYNITLADYQEMAADQSDGCAICGRPPKTVALSVDHDHSYKRLSLLAVKASNGWVVAARYRGTVFSATSKVRVIARRKLMRHLLRASVRGLLCSLCNRGLQKYGDNPGRLVRAANYLQRHQSGAEGAFPMLPPLKAAA